MLVSAEKHKFVFIKILHAKISYTISFTFRFQPFKKQNMQFFKILRFKKCIAIFVLAWLFNGCIPQKETVYFQDQSNRNNYKNPYGEQDVITEKYILKPNDQLFINVTTSNTKLSEYFNPNRSSSGASQQSAMLYTYPIDDNMDIDFPFVGKINLRGCTRAAAKQKVTEALLPFLSDAQLTVRLSGASFVALGEFGNVGRIDMGKEQITIYEAVALAGDVKPSGKKRKVKIVRPTDEGSEFFYVDLTDKNLVDSDHFYVYNNDIIYIRPMRAKAWGIGETFPYGLVGSLLALFITVQALIK